MPRFDKNNIGELKEFIYKSCPHDATVENVKCSCKGNSIEIELYNTFFNVGMNLIFRIRKEAAHTHLLPDQPTAAAEVVSDALPTLARKTDKKHFIKER